MLYRCYYSKLCEYTSLEPVISYSQLSGSPDIDFNIVEAHIDEEWNWQELSRKSHLKLELVQKYPDKNWDWYVLSTHPDLTIQFVEQFPNKSWNWSVLPNRLNMELDVHTHNKISPKHIVNWYYFQTLIKSYINYCYKSVLRFINNFGLKKGFTASIARWKLILIKTDEEISNYPDLTIVENNINQNWNWKELSKHPDLTLMFVWKHMNKGWEWQYLEKRFDIDQLRDKLNLYSLYCQCSFIQKN